MYWLLNKIDQWQLWLTIAILIFLSLTGCAPNVQTVFLPFELTRPPKPLVPRITAGDLACNSKDVVQKIMDRDRIISDYANLLATIIDSTKQEVLKK